MIQTKIFFWITNGFCIELPHSTACGFYLFKIWKGLKWLDFSSFLTCYANHVNINAPVVEAHSRLLIGNWTYEIKNNFSFTCINEWNISLGVNCLLNESGSSITLSVISNVFLREYFMPSNSKLRLRNRESTVAWKALAWSFHSSKHPPVAL